MPRSWRLARQAEAAMLDIARWTIGHFGPLQAASYEQDLIDHCRGIAAGTTVSRPCRELVAPDLPEDLRFTRCGQHFLVFIDAEDMVVIVDVLHVRSDLPGHLAKLANASRTTSRL
ncbi:type II toxin-antitoxin system RelE/ParE family toxin [Maricaulis sp.]|uniref:type II toxin-antitoxin system RelE/ParE family toxin n=1 Tax=Maricaulis sp. TaxID=1486257 RepID=UPI003A8F242C